MDNTKQQLQKLIEQLKAKKFRDEEAQGMTKSIGGEITKQLKPAFEALGKGLSDNISNAIKGLSVNVPEGKEPKVTVNVPDVIVPEIRVPEPKVTVNVPPFPRIPDFPKIEMPETMKVMGEVEIANNNYSNPLKVQLVDLKNRPYESVGGGGFGGGVKINNSSSEAIPVTITSGSSATSASNIVDSSGVAYSGSNPIPVTITSGATATTAVNVVDSSGVAYSGTNPIPVAFGATTTTAGTILNGDGTYRDTFPISGTVTGITNTIGVYSLDSAGNYKDTQPVSGSVAVSGITGSIGATILNGEGVARDSWLVSDITNSLKSALIDSTGIQYSGSNPLPITIISTAAAGATGSMAVSIIGSDGLAFGTTKPIPVTMVAGVSGTTGTANVDSSGVQYSGSNPMPTYLVAGAGNSTVSVGVTVSDAVDDGSAPIKNGGIARTANPAAVAGGDIVTYSADDLGRQITRPVQVRDLIATAYVNKTTGSTFGTETALLSGAANTYHDLIYVLGANDSTVAIGCDFRATLAGNVMFHLEIPANSTAGMALPVPIPAGDVGASWTIDLPDVTGTNVYVSALFSKEV